MHSRMAIDFKEEILRWMGRTHVGIIVVRMSAATSGNFAGTVPGIAFAHPGYGTTDLDAASRPDRASSARDAQSIRRIRLRSRGEPATRPLERPYSAAICLGAGGGVTRSAASWA